MTQSKMQVVYCEDGLLHNPPMEMTLGQIKPYVGKYIYTRKSYKIFMSFYDRISQEINQYQEIH